jgi:SMI1/KNR4 family protein SUKH-1
MTESDIDEVESKLGIRVPSDYRQLMLSHSGQTVAGVFGDKHQIISANERNRQMSWLGRPLDGVFFIFGADEHGRELFMDLDTREPVIMVADYEHQRGAVQARTFRDWISRHYRVA